MGSEDPPIAGEVVRPTTRRALALTIIGALLIVVGTDIVAKAYLDRFSPNPAYWLIIDKWALLRAQTEPVDWLILGDSSCNQGVDPSRFRERGAGSALNLCVLADLLAEHDVWMLEEYLERVGPPRKGVVVMHVYDMWHRDATTALLAKVPLRWGYWEAGERGENLPASQEWRVFLERFAPLYTEQQSLRALIATPTYAFTRPKRKLGADGFGPSVAADEAGVDEDASAHRAFAATHVFSMSERNAWALNRLEALAETHGFSIYLVNAPLYESLPLDSRFAAYYADVSHELGRRARASGRIRYVLERPMTFPRNEMVNVDHVTAGAARRFTDRVLDEMGVLQNFHTYRLENGLLPSNRGGSRSPIAGVAPRAPAGRGRP